MKWNYGDALVRIGRALLLIHMGECLVYPPEWSSIQNMPENADLYPQNDYQAAQARDALHGSSYGGDVLYQAEAPTPESDVVKGNTYRWPGFPGKGVIPYRISRKLKYMKKKILAAMQQYRKHTCIRFVRKKKHHIDYIFIRDGNGCSSFIGRLGGRQYVTLGSGCEYIGTIVHELGHAVGLYHEHQRYDRNKYIQIFKTNIAKGQEHNFDKTPKNEQMAYTPFDYYSIMIYGEYAFSISPGRLKTMKARKKKVRLTEPFQKPGLDNLDIKQINELYECRKLKLYGNNYYFSNAWTQSVIF